MDRRQANELDNHITGHYGEDQFQDEDEPSKLTSYMEEFHTAFQLHMARNPRIQNPYLHKLRSMCQEIALTIARSQQRVRSGSRELRATRTFLCWL